MKKILFIIVIFMGGLTFYSCSDYLDVNTNPNGPDDLLPAEYYLPAIQSELTVGIQWDGRFTGFYTQNWLYATGYTLNLHANPTLRLASDSYSQLWRNIYWSMGYNMLDMIESAEKDERYDFVGVGYILQAMGWQVLTDYHGPIILSQAYEPDRYSFDYDEQPAVWEEIQRLLKAGIEQLERTDGRPAEETNLSKGDIIYKGDRQKWIKFAYGLLAINAHRLTNKSSYDPNEVIQYVDKSFTSNDDDAFFSFIGNVSDDTNFFGPLRGNIAYYRQSKFIVGLLDGTNPELTDPGLMDADPNPDYAGEYLKDPRITAMLAPSPDGNYRGIEPESGVIQYPADLVPKSLWNRVGYGTGGEADPQIYIFNNAEKFPLMTYAELQFIKSEAAFLGNQRDVALDAYKKGIDAHMDFARQFSPEPEWFDQRRELYKTSEVYYPSTSSGLTLSKIMLQKYIATWGWGFFESWSDMRRYHYDIDNNPKVYPGFELPHEFYAWNHEKPIYRARPRYNSEYMWNKEALEKVGGYEEDYHTKETWFSIPE